MPSPKRVSTWRPAVAALPASIPSVSVTPSPDTLVRPSADIEMGSVVPPGHRRRRSSAANGAASQVSVSHLGHLNGERGTRPRGESLPGGSSIIAVPEHAPGGSSGTGDDDNDDSTWDDAWDDGFDDLDEEAGLTAPERRRRAEVRRQRTQLDQRVVPGASIEAGHIVDDGNGPAVPISEDERKLADKAVVRRLVIDGTLIGLWYLFSLSISLYNKWMFGGQNLNFPFPLFTTCIHMLVQFTLSSTVLYFVPSLRPGAGSSSNNSSSSNNDGSYNDDDDEDDDVYKPQHEAEPRPTLMTKMFYLTRIGPCGAATGLDIGLGNTSLKFITLTFYTMCKSSSLAFVLLFAFAFRLETPTLRLVAIIATMTAGVVMMVAGEVEFKLGGFLLVISAAFFSGFRWALTQIMLLRHPATSNPFSSIFYLAPVMFATLFVLAVPTEGLGALSAGFGTLVDKFGPLRAPALVLFPGTIAFLMTASEFALLQRTSVVTLSIAGIFKEVVTIATSTLVYHDTLTTVNILGLVVTMTAIIAYNYINITKMRQQAQQHVHQERRRSSSFGSDSSSVHYYPSLAPVSSSSPAMAATGDDSDVEVEAEAENAGLLRKHTPSRQAGELLR
ncbi:hypothetical protein CMQ_1749 [Grosmannia clavigera kw1407]|uniref:Sugar phosphate transporter domain-containing protein n=1 Tax=Grosmannia clavigera (strain kw1407 / UAMH 11150) TaxID=655863 RepID=F0XDA6_GROCL|nr:uncharacterized protein CMQ_1749 [Grosmannia clavigera kw1407]EFX04821.1 hypothetical protein CMQ_1749 [Grosmannia clavigera kw1407]